MNGTGFFPRFPPLVVPQGTALEFPFKLMMSFVFPLLNRLQGFFKACFYATVVKANIAGGVGGTRGGGGRAESGEPAC